MSKTTGKRDPLSRYFKDLDEEDISSGSDDSNDEAEAEEPTPVPRRESTKAEPKVEVTSSGTNWARSNDKTSSSSQGQSEEQSKENSLTADSTTSPKSTRLPSAHECLKRSSKPEFLRLDEQKDVNWDSVHKQLPGEDEDQPVTEFKSSAVPPPNSYEPVTDPGIKVVDSEGRKRKTIGDDLQDQMTSKKAYRVEEPESQ
ncbi:UPF0690 protein C1orf52 homolog isoform X2 [Aplysia californica]|uniref:UPF0690 protein C1orf52 homolog isoform X2 n=1 Tax=Aplysia californica TaxID=6500 RepID=A0ABM0KB86_APLCA|nr:UPF0690 protein C1orf52 homolog isoform X2 [Aplysia californica]